MSGNQPVILKVPPGKERESSETCKKTIEFNINILDKQVLFRIEVFTTMLKLSELVPFARELSSKISDIIFSRVREQGISIPCQKGCSTCCSYLVPLSIPEAFQLRKEILALPVKNRKAVLDLFFKGAKKILEEKPDNSNLLETDKLSEWYSNLELHCPFLSDNICSIYEKRPIACREYLVTGSELLCKPGQQGDFHKVDLPVSVLECLGQLCAELEQTDVEALMMPLALPWAEENLSRNEKMWPASELVQRLIKIIEDSVKNSCIACSHK